jgi:hypothetical protein
MPTLALGRAHYIQFYNTMWLIANDMIVGSAFTSFVCENSEYLGRLLGRVVQVSRRLQVSAERFSGYEEGELQQLIVLSRPSSQEYTLTSLRELLLWLNDWPGGVKLNFELASIFCDGFLWGTGLWEERESSSLSPLFPQC